MSGIVHLNALGGDDVVFADISIVEPRCRISDPNNCASIVPELKSGFLFPLRTSVRIMMRPGVYEEYEIYLLLGGGSFGEVYQARTAGVYDVTTRSIVGRRYVAIKFMKKIDEDRELDVISSIPPDVFKCKTLVRYRAYHTGTSAFKRIGRCSNYANLGLLMMDIARVGSPIDWLVRINRRHRRYHFPVTVARRAMRDIILCLAHLRRFGVCHRDLKSDNIFIDGSGRFLVGDLGHAKVIPSTTFGAPMITDTVRGIGGDYNSPELLNASVFRLAKASYDAEKVDVWGLGNILFTFLGAVNIWSFDRSVRRGLLDQELSESPPLNTVFWEAWDIARKKYPTGIIDESAKMLLNRLLSYHPQHRPTFGELEAAVQGTNSDPSLAWLASPEVCTIDELETELNERNPNSVKFLKTFQLIRKVQRMAGVMARFKQPAIPSKAGAMEDSSPTIDDLSVEASEITLDEAPVDVDDDDDDDEFFDAADGQDMPLSSDDAVPLSDPLARPIICWEIPNTTTGVASLKFMQAVKETFRSLVLEYPSLKAGSESVVDDGTSEGAVSHLGLLDEFIDMNIIQSVAEDSARSQEIVIAELKDASGESRLKFSASMVSSISEEREATKVEVRRLWGDMVEIKGIVDRALAVEEGETKTWLFVGNEEP